ncbi:MAG: site-2 protease family protein, partial [Clostridia bacterium]
MLPLGTVWGVAIRMHMAFPLWIAAGIAFGYGRLLGVLLCVLCVHEAAHAWMAAALGLRVCSLELMPFGGVARIEGMLTLRPLQEVLIALAGPCSNLLMAMGAALGVYLFHIPGKTV